MLATHLYNFTLRETPADAEVISHKYMLRAGMIRKVVGGIYSYLPLAKRTIRKIEKIVREEMEIIGGQEILMPILQPSEIWKETNRWSVYGEEMFRLKDRHGREYCLAPTHEELITNLVKSDVNSYRNLPLCLFQIQNKYRDEVRPRFGLMRGREFIMKDAYSFDVDQAGLDEYYRKMYNAYMNIFNRCGLYFHPVEADSGAIGGSGTHEFMALAQSGEADIVHCQECDYAANIEIAQPETLKPIKNSTNKAPEKIMTPGQTTIDLVASYFNVPLEQTIKAVVFSVDEKLVLVMVRGDHEVNTVKLTNMFNAVSVEFAADEKLSEAGLKAGYLSPIGLEESKDLTIVVDKTVMDMEDVVCGANEVDFHYIHISPIKDFKNVLVETVRLINENDVCPRCSGKIKIDCGIEVGQVFKLGTKYSEAFGATFLDKNGKAKPLVMGCYGIGITRTMAAAIEQHHDEQGIIWPAAIAPFTVVIIPANTKDEQIMSVSKQIYNDLLRYGEEVLLDDRNERAGIKFKDADLIGYPLRITIGKKYFEDGKVEIKIRSTGEVFEILPEETVFKAKELLLNL